MRALLESVALAILAAACAGCGRATVPNPCVLLTTEEVKGLSERVAYYSLQPQAAGTDGKACAWNTDEDKALVMLIAGRSSGGDLEQQLKTFFSGAEVRVVSIPGIGSNAAAAFSTKGNEGMVTFMATDGRISLSMQGPVGSESSPGFAKASELMKIALARTKTAK